MPELVGTCAPLSRSRLFQRTALGLGLAASLLACTSSGDEHLSHLTLRMTQIGSLPAGAQSLSLVVQSVAVHVGNPGAEAVSPDDTSIDPDGRWQILQSNKSVVFPTAAAGVELGSLSLPVGSVNQIQVTLGPVAGLVANQGGCTIDLQGNSNTGWRLTLPFKSFPTYHGIDHVGTLALDLGAALVPAGDCYQLQQALGVATWQTDGHFIAVN